MAPPRRKKITCGGPRRSRRIRHKSPLPFGPCNAPRKGASHIRTCPFCSGSGRVDKRAKKNRCGRAPKGYFHLFFKHVCQRMKENNIRQSGCCTMIQAGVCWRSLSEEQKQDFINRVSGGRGLGSSSSRGCGDCGSSVGNATTNGATPQASQFGFVPTKIPSGFSFP